MLDSYIKYEILNKIYLESGESDIFHPQTATDFYDVDFFNDGLKINEDYEVLPNVTISNKGITPTLDMRFTNAGIKKLLAIKPKMRKEIDDIWEVTIREIEDD